MTECKHVGTPGGVLARYFADSLDLSRRSELVLRVVCADSPSDAAGRGFDPLSGFVDSRGRVQTVFDDFGILSDAEEADADAVARSLVQLADSLRCSDAAFVAALVRAASAVAASGSGGFRAASVLCDECRKGLLEVADERPGCGGP